ncbi:Ferric enterobactin transport ATP-binding protein FepC [Paraconexibacter sp. AEG42_29]|uniref:Ferric enterobactin transport ATP-binding protein FepC n=1 Tax=Paraconexibacter sp. AEG42_29 TaxID=2997339 RepID=A0AAU7B2F1_9ACTN
MPEGPSSGAPLQVDALTLAYGDRTIVADLTTLIPGGRITAIVGPNACGKSTLLRSMARLLAPRSGAVLLDGDAVHRLKTRDVARRIGLLPQSPITPEGITVKELVERGRFPHRKALRPPSREDRDKVAWALEATGVADLQDRPVDELSGGQRQRAWIALALAQDTGVLLLDEPTTYLDIAHQIEVLDLVHRLNRQDGRTIALVLHDLNQACRYADHLIALRDGRLHAAGPPAEVVDAALVQDVFGVAVTVMEDPVCGVPMTVPLGLPGGGVAPAKALSTPRGD